MSTLKNNMLPINNEKNKQGGAIPGVQTYGKTNEDAF